MQVEVPPNSNVDLLVDTNLPDPEAAIAEYVRVLEEAKNKKTDQHVEESDSDEYSVYSDEDSDDFTAKKRKRQRQRKAQVEASVANDLSASRAVGSQLTPFAAASAFHARLIDLLHVSTTNSIVVNMSFSLRR